MGTGLEIESGLKEHMTFTEVGKKLGGQDYHYQGNKELYRGTGYNIYPHNTCKYRKTYNRKTVCGTNDCKHPLVTVRKQYESICNRYCEYCFEKKVCTLTKTIYDALEAYRKATAKISKSRNGIFSTEGEIARLNEILVPLVKQGQSITRFT